MEEIAMPNFEKMTDKELDGYISELKKEIMRLYTLTTEPTDNMEYFMMHERRFSRAKNKFEEAHKWKIKKGLEVFKEIGD